MSLFQQPLDWAQRESHGTLVTARDERTLALEAVRDAARHDHRPFLMALDAVLAKRDWRTKRWGWDYPAIAMTAAMMAGGWVVRGAGFKPPP